MLTFVDCCVDMLERIQYLVLQRAPIFIRVFFCRRKHHTKIMINLNILKNTGDRLKLKKHILLIIPDIRHIPLTQETFPSWW